jgi:hypothetical protein
MKPSLSGPVLFMLLVQLLACQGKKVPSADTARDEKAVSALLDTLNARAARADFTGYFNLYAEASVFMGTDATERWDKKQFMDWSKPIFDRGRAWNFSSLERHIYFDGSGQLAWFDELLNTQMKICRGSGVAVREGNEWKLKQYVLSMTVPNSLVDTLVPLKAPEEDSLINRLKNP